jgi:hypothetical protein
MSCHLASEMANLKGRDDLGTLVLAFGVKIMMCLSPSHSNFPITFNSHTMNTYDDDYN